MIGLGGVVVITPVMGDNQGSQPESVLAMGAKSVLAPTPADANVIFQIEQENRERIEWALEEIADNCLKPSPGRQWAGYETIIASLVRKFAITIDEAKLVVQQAVESLASTPDDVGQRELTLLRLRRIRQILMTTMAQPIVETRYTFQPSPDDPKKMIKIHSREKITTGLQDAKVRLLLIVEKMMLEARGLDDGRNADPIETLYTQMVEQDGDGKVKKSKSLTQRLKMSQISDLPAGKEIVQKALAEKQRRNVQSKMVDASDDDHR